MKWKKSSGRAWIERTLISVFVESHDHDWPASIVLRQQK